MQTDTIPLSVVEYSIKNGFAWAKCKDTHPDQCNLFCFNSFFRVWKNTYQTYGIVYLIQLLFKIKEMRKKPKQQIPKFIISYLKSTSLTAVQMMIMRRILCFLANNYRTTQNNLIPANFLSGFYLCIESPTRQCQILLYQLNKTTQLVYNMLSRRKLVKPLPRGQCLLFAMSIAWILYNYFNNKDSMRKNYIITILDNMFLQC